MAAVEVTISGLLYDRLARTTQQVVLVGEAMLSGLGVGGGPIVPPGGGGGGGEKPPSIWGPTDPRPTPPIALPPGVTPPDPPAGGGNKPPPEGAAGWGFYDSRWGYFPAPDEASPKG